MSAWAQNKTQLCTQALDIVGKSNNLSPDASALQRASNCLMRTLVDLGNDGLIVNEIEQVTTNTQTSTNVTSYRCIKSHVATALNQPGVGDEWTEFWYYDTGVTGAVWTLGTSYKSSGDISIGTDTIDIVSCSIKENQQETQIEVIGYDRYASIPLKSTTGFPITVYPIYIGTDPRLYFYYIPDKTYQVVYFRVKEISNLTLPTSTLNFKSNLFNAIITLTAAKLADIYGLPIQERMYLEAKAVKALNKARINDYSSEDNRICNGSYNNI